MFASNSCDDFSVFADISSLVVVEWAEHSTVSLDTDVVFLESVGSHLLCSVRPILLSSLGLLLSIRLSLRTTVEQLIVL